MLNEIQHYTLMFFRLIPDNEADPASSGDVTSATHAVANITSGGVDVVARNRNEGGNQNGIHHGGSDQVMRSSKSDLSLSIESLPLVDSAGNKTR